MNRTLYLIRHSYAEDSNGGKDIDRDLTLKGQNSVRVLGRYLLSKHIDLDNILCSPSKRTTKTAINLVEELGISEQLIDYQDVIYNASVRELLAVIHKVKVNHKEIAIIGHNPAITYLGEFLTRANIGNIDPSGIVVIKFTKLKWDKIAQGVGTFEWRYNPNY